MEPVSIGSLFVEKTYHVENKGTGIYVCTRNNNSPEFNNFFLKVLHVVIVYTVHGYLYRINLVGFPHLDVAGGLCWQ